MAIKILGMEESETLIRDLSKFLTKSKIKLINIPTKTRHFLIDYENIEFFDSAKTRDQIKKINEIKNDFDLCVVTSWNTARIAYLCGLKYIFYFVGDDIRIPPFEKNLKPDYITDTLNRPNFLERKFYRLVFDNAIACVTGSAELFNWLKKFRKNAIRIDRTLVDPTIFNTKVKSINIQKKKFNFFCPQKIGIEKGTDLLWKSISLCKSDFDILQVEWFDEKSNKIKKQSQDLLKIKPPQVKLIRKIQRDEMAKYYVFSDAVLGEFRTGHTNSIEREASLCQKAVLCYNNKEQKVLLDGKELVSPFLPTTQNPIDIASTIDKVVTSKKFRDDLAQKEYLFMRELTNPYKTAKEWDELFVKLEKQVKTIKKDQSSLKTNLKMLFFKIADFTNPNSEKSLY